MHSYLPTPAHACTHTHPFTGQYMQLSRDVTGKLTESESESGEEWEPGGTKNNNGGAREREK